TARRTGTPRRLPGSDAGLKRNGPLLPLFPGVPTMSARTSFATARTRWFPVVRQVIDSLARRGFCRRITHPRFKPAWEALEGRCLLSYSITDLGTFGGRGSVAYGINGSGQVVGYANLPGDTVRHAFLYDPTATPPMRDLGTLGGTNSTA